ncbi:MAG: AhpC/TSA family protein [Verrucomicrobiaceae bacterium]|nr:MAG: AhpC/TSA family protein [Verrucomicrobiaceae bacterium]
MSRRIKVALTLLSALLLLSVIGMAFWYQDLRYSLPTPQPEHYTAVPSGAAIPPTPLLPATDKRLLFLHFFNPDCPCSRFNVDHVRSLYLQYREQVQFLAVVQTDSDATPEEMQTSAAEASSQLLGMEAIIDRDGHIATACGVYSTPQAVVLSPGRELLFRGNYNVSRFCSDKKTAFARVALEALLEGKSLPQFPPVATTAYGCQLPTFLDQEK